MPYRNGVTKKAVLTATGKSREVKFSEKAIKVKDVLSRANFGCRKQVVAELMSVALDENIAASMAPEPMSAVVLLSNPNSHNYPLNEVLIVSRQDLLYKYNGDEGNHAPFDILSAWRFATDKEIEAQFKK